MHEVSPQHLLNQGWISVTVDGTFHEGKNQSAVGGCLKDNLGLRLVGYGKCFTWKHPPET